ncbi:hypothetical protein RJ640_015079 [Escallonia rubra]|uniref:Uncharacterized protein n=1 Tax=Escallonia rubra TaxID=112253 RepID=A0AA88RTL6_9ASTE|nr:hypothetical protein RJ640_015079 [Escallonia rubra]
MDFSLRMGWCSYRPARWLKNALRSVNGGDELAKPVAGRCAVVIDVEAVGDEPAETVEGDWGSSEDLADLGAIPVAVVSAMVVIGDGGGGGLGLVVDVGVGGAVMRPALTCHADKDGESDGEYGSGMVVSRGTKRLLAEGPSEEPALNSSYLVLAARRTNRKDPLDGFKKYTGGWNISEHHYWASDTTVDKLRNVSEYLAAAKQIGVDSVFLPTSIQTDIDQIEAKINSSANTLANRTDNNSDDIHDVLDSVVTSDTCVAMNQWVEYPTARTALDNILPCVDNATAQETLSKSKEVTSQLVNVVNQVITNVSNINFSPNFVPLYYNQSGPLMPTLCNPFTPDLRDRRCTAGEVDLNNATEVWSNYVCQVSSSGNCATTGRITPAIYNQMAAGVNVSYGLYNYGPFLVELQDCTFVRQTFAQISTEYCPGLRRYSKWVYVGLVMVSAAVMLSLLFWVIYGRERRHRVYTKEHMAGPGHGFEEDKHS